jgi:hypothetical protein
MRPTLYIGLGGFGCDVLRELKKSIRELGDDYLDGTAFIGMDTHPESKTDELTTNEYIPLSLGVVPEDVARANRNFLGWYLEAAPYLKAKPIGAGADQIKAIGRLAFRFPTTLTKFTTQLDADWEQLKRFRERYSDSLAPKVYVISTVAGGTGAGCLADVLLVVGHFLRSRRTTSKYHAVLVTGDVLVGEVSNDQEPWLRSNTYSTFKELHHFYHATGKSEAYDEKDYKSVALDIQNLPEPSFLLGGENESGAVVASKIEDLRSMVVSYLRAEIMTPAVDEGSFRAFDFENAKTFRARPQENAPMRTFASFGVVQVGFPIDIAGEYFARLVAQEVLSRELKSRGDADVYAAVDAWLQARSLKEAGQDQLQDRLKAAVGNTVMDVNVDARGAILQRKVKREQLMAECRTYKQDIEQTFGADREGAIRAKAGELSAALAADLSAALEETTRTNGVGETTLFLNKLQVQLADHRDALTKEMADATQTLGKLESETEQSIQAVAGCLQCHFWERKRYIEDSLSSFGQVLEGLLRMRLKVWVMESADTIYAGLLSACRTAGLRWNAVKETTQGRLKTIEDGLTRQALELDRLARLKSRGPGNRFSLVNAERARQMYEKTVGSDLDAVVSRTRTEWLKSKQLFDLELRPHQWFQTILPGLLASEVKPKLNDYDMLKVMNTFYPSDNDRRVLFSDLSALSQPLFWMNPDRNLPDWYESWVFAAHPSLVERLKPIYEKYFQAAVGSSWARFNSPYEILIYRNKAAYQLCQHLNIARYRGAYEDLARKNDAASRKKETAMPVDAWPGAHDWGGLEPEVGVEEAQRLFVLGRAFTDLFPEYGIETDPRTQQTTLRSNGKGDAFITQSGNSYYIRLADKERKARMGQSLAEAVDTFVKQPDWQKAIDSRVESASENVARPDLRGRLEEWAKGLDAEIEASVDKHRTEEEEVLFKKRLALLNALRDYIKQELSGGKL